MKSRNPAGSETPGKPSLFIIMTAYGNDRERSEPKFAPRAKRAGEANL
jgi:hypothetical protein